MKCRSVPFNVLALVCGTLLLCSFVFAQDAVVPDPNLANAIRSSLGLSESDPITAELLLDVTHLHAVSFIGDDDDSSSAGFFIPVEDLTGLEQAKNLETLYLRGRSGPGHNVTDLAPLAGLTNLTTLRLPNALKGTPEEKFAATEVIGGLAGLTSLSLEQDGIENRHLEQLSELDHLQGLDIDDNAITDLSALSGFLRLQSLDIDKNPVVDLRPLQTLQQLRNLDAHPGIADMATLPAMMNLRVIQAGSDMIDLAPLARQMNLRNANIHGRIADLTPLANLPMLSGVTLRNALGHPVNGVTDLRPVRLMPMLHQGSFTEIIGGSRVDVADPGTAAIIEEQNLGATGFADPAEYDPDAPVPDSRLRPRDLSRNWIETRGVIDLTGVGTLELTTLNATDGWITDLSPLRDSPEITSLNLSNNFISDVTPIADREFVSLNLLGNPIDPDTIPEAWLNDGRVLLDPIEKLQLEESILDPALRRAIRRSIGAPLDATVDGDALSQLVWLYAENSRIRSLAGLELATSLRGAAFRNNIIKELSPMAGLSELQWLRVSGNPLSDDATGMIQSLKARGVSVDDSEAGRFLSAITPVRGVVYASGYQLSSLRYLELFPDLEEAFLSDNYLTDVTQLEAMPDLRTVYLDGNLLALEDGGSAKAVVDGLVGRGVDVNVDPQRSLGGEHAIPDPTVQAAIAAGLGLPFARQAYSTEQLEEVTLLDWASLYDNTDAVIADTSGIERLVNLEELSLERAGLTDVSFLSGLTMLEVLDLDYNRISDLSPLAGLTEIIELDVNGNDVRSIAPLAGLTKLKQLDLDANHIADLSPLVGLTALRELDIHQNRIRNLSPLRALDLDLLNIQLNGLDINDPTVSGTIDALRAEGVDLGNTTPQFFPVVEATHDRRRGRVQLQWEAETGVVYFLDHSPELAFPTFNRTVVAAQPGESEVRLDFPIDDDRERYYQVLPVTANHF